MNSDKYMVLVESGRNIYYYFESLEDALEKVEELILVKNCVPEDIRVYKQVEMKVDVQFRVKREEQDD